MSNSQGSPLHRVPLTEHSISEGPPKGYVVGRDENNDSGTSVVWARAVVCDGVGRVQTVGHPGVGTGRPVRSSSLSVSIQKELV